MPWKVINQMDIKKELTQDGDAGHHEINTLNIRIDIPNIQCIIMP
jgi:hypothetical protein